MNQLQLKFIMDAFILPAIIIGLMLLLFVPVYWSVNERKNTNPNPHKPWKR